MIDSFHSNGTQLTKNVFSIITLRSVDMDRYQAGQKLDACCKNRYSVRERVVAGSVPQGSFQEHAGALANLQHWAVRAVVSQSLNGGTRPKVVIELNRSSHPLCENTQNDKPKII